jgi:uncharacterized SAM-binding protein YcdF (DUF218 family)
MSLRKHWKKIVLGLAASLFLLVGAAFLFPQQVLVLDQGNARGDVIVVLGGGSGERPVRAAELFRAGAAARILVSGAGDADGNRLLLMHRGVPSAAITLEPDSRTTRENAQLSIPLLRSIGAKKVILVTSWYHSRRALRCFQHYAPDLDFSSCPSRQGIDRAEWSQSHLRRRIRAEYVKIVGYWFYYGVCPL